MLYTVESSSLYVYFMTHHFLGKDIYIVLFIYGTGPSTLQYGMSHRK